MPNKNVTLAIEMNASRLKMPLVLAGCALFGVMAGLLITFVSPSGAPSLPVSGTPTTRILRVEQPAPNFVLETVDGTQQISLSSLKGKRVLINFWASWCTPCIRETPDLVKAYAELKQGGDTDIEFLGVATKDELAPARAFAEANNVNYPVLFDKSGFISETYWAFGLPTTVFVDATGNVFKTHIGLITSDDVVAQFASMRKIPAPK